MTVRYSMALGWLGSRLAAMVAMTAPACGEGTRESGRSMAVPNAAPGEAMEDGGAEIPDRSHDGGTPREGPADGGLEPAPPISGTATSPGADAGSGGSSGASEAGGAAGARSTGGAAGRTSGVAGRTSEVAGGVSGSGGSVDGGGGTRQTAGTGTGGGGPEDREAWVLFNTVGVVIEDNPFGIQGRFFVFQDGFVDGDWIDDDHRHTRLAPTEFDENANQPCVSGEVGVVASTSGSGCNPQSESNFCEWDAVWGGGVGVQLKASEANLPDSESRPWDARAANVTGFSFQTSGSTSASVLRFKAKMAGSDDEFCVEFLTPAAGAYLDETVLLSELRHNCHSSQPATETLDISKIEELRWQLLAGSSTSSVNQFCIERLEAF